MKKLLLALLSILVLFFAGVYIFIPAKLNITSSVVAKTTDLGTERFVIDETKWEQWWNYNNQFAESKNPQQGKTFLANGYEFKVTGKFYKSLEIEIHSNKQQVASKLVIVPLALDSTGIEWKSELAMGSNPFSRISRYMEAKSIKKIMDEVLLNLKNFLSKPENVYSINIERNHLKDTLYVSSKVMLSAYPSNKEIFDLIYKINAYIEKNGTRPTGSPIYNVTEMDRNRFQLMAAVPVNRSLKEIDGFAMKYMVKGSFIISEVVGGNATVNTAAKNLQQYFDDYKKTSMAMNFTMLVTDRMLQPDSSKWITRLYHPVY